jgi:hypothetical protein
MNVTVSRFFQRTPPLEKKESRDDDGNDERFITTTKTQFCDEFSSAHARRVSEMMRVGVFFSPEKRLMMTRETKERERERKREKVTKWQNQKKNQKTKKFLLLLSAFFFFCIFSYFFTVVSHNNKTKEKMGKKGTASKKKQSPGAAAAKTPSLPNKVSRDSYFFSFLFDDSFVVKLRCVLEISHLSAARTHHHHHHRFS